MDDKQQKILNRIYAKYNIRGKKIVFKQFRNLKDFRFFKIERINPSHHIKLLGNPKKQFIHDGHYGKIINVGEITIFGVALLFNINFVVYWLYCLGLTLFCFDLIMCCNVKELLLSYVNWCRRGCWVRKNSIRS